MPSELNIEHKNPKDLLFRNVTVALLDLLNRKITIDQVVDGKIQTETVPFFYHFSGDENFMKDFFMELPTDCKIPSHAEGNFETYPKGVLKMNSFSVKPNEITNKFVRGTVKKAEYTADDQKVLKAYSAYLFALPININFEAKITADSMNQALQIISGLLEEFYKQYFLFYQFRGIKIPAQYEFNDTAPVDKKFDFTYADDNKIYATCDIVVETFYPIFDSNTMEFKGDRIEEFRNSIKTIENENLEDFTTPTNDYTDK